jgi:hypothetical protein
VSPALGPSARHVRCLYHRENKKTPTLKAFCKDASRRRGARSSANICYTIQCGDDNLQLEVVNCVGCRTLRGPPSNLDFVRFMWSTFVRYFRSHAVIVGALQRGEIPADRMYTQHREYRQI